MIAVPTTREIGIEAFRPTVHLPVVTAWMQHPRAEFWELTDASAEEIAEEYHHLDQDPHHHVHLGRVGGEPAFLAETYDPAHSPLASFAPVRRGDLGMHLLVAPPVRPRPGFTRAVFAAVMRFCFADPGVQRVVVEPDLRNQRIAVLNAAAGFEVADEVTLPTKTAALSFCTRAAFAASELGAHP